MVEAPPEGPIVCPTHVVRNERAKGYWDFYLANLAPGHLRPCDAPFLSRLAMAYARVDEAEEEMELTGGMVITNENGGMMQSPWLSIINRQTEIIRKLASELCIPPSMRNRVGSPERKMDANPAARYFD